MLGGAGRRIGARHREQGDLAAREKLVRGDRLGAGLGHFGEVGVRHAVANLDRHVSLSSKCVSAPIGARGGFFKHGGPESAAVSCFAYGVGALSYRTVPAGDARDRRSALRARSDRDVRA